MTLADICSLILVNAVCHVILVSGVMIPLHKKFHDHQTFWQ